MHIEKINSFAEAEVKWNDTKPIRGKEVDMRPLGKRHRKYERIAKIDDNCYALLDGGTGCNSTWSGHYNTVTWAEVRMLAPILWERHADGTETVRVRNESSTHGHAQQRYSFLQRAMPRGLGWVNRNGKHFIRIRNWVCRQRALLTVKQHTACWASGECALWIHDRRRPSLCEV
jgi:hypothetical protein